MMLAWLQLYDSRGLQIVTDRSLACAELRSCLTCFGG
jgi:hypothetical protein